MGKDGHTKSSAAFKKPGGAGAGSPSNPFGNGESIIHFMAWMVQQAAEQAEPEQKPLVLEAGLVLSLSGREAGPECHARHQSQHHD